MMRNYFYRKTLIPTHEVYFDLSVCYEISRLVGNIQIVTNAFMVLLSFFCGMDFDVIARMCIFWLIFWTIFKRGCWNVYLWPKSIPNNSSYMRLLSWPLPTSICKKLWGLVKGQGFLLFTFKYLFWNNLKTVNASFSSLLNTRSIRLTITDKKIAHVYSYKRKRTLDRSLRNTHK